MPTALILCGWVILVHFFGFVFLIIVYQRYLTNLSNNSSYIVEEDPLLRVYSALICTTIILAVVTLGHGTLFMGTSGGVTAMLMGLIYLNVGTLALRSVTKASRPLFPSREINDHSRPSIVINRRLRENVQEYTHERHPANTPPSYSIESPDRLPTISVISRGPTGPSTEEPPTAYGGLDLPPPYWEAVNRLETVLEVSEASSSSLNTYKETCDTESSPQPEVHEDTQGTACTVRRNLPLYPLV